MEAACCNLPHLGITVKLEKQGSQHVLCVSMLRIELEHTAVASLCSYPVALLVTLHSLHA